MSMENREFQAALTRLESMAKGQLYHTPNDSDPGSWAGTSTTDDQDAFTDDIDENGTDYNGVKKALATKIERSQALTPAEVAIVKGQDPRPAIQAKISKGEALTPAEGWVLKGGFAKMAKGNDKPSAAPTPGEGDNANSVPDTNAGENEDDEIIAQANKSLDGAIANSDHLAKGLEMSPILVEFTRAMGEALNGLEARTALRIEKSVMALAERVGQMENLVAKSFNEQGEFNKGFAETLVGVGQHVAGNAEIATSQAQMPAGPPKSQLRAVPGGQAPEGVQAVQKSFAGGMDVGSEALAKSQVIGAMADLVEKGRLNSLDVVKYEMTGEINPAVSQMVMAHVQGGNQ
jgi:hypothetical protein